MSIIKTIMSKDVQQQHQKQQQQVHLTFHHNHFWNNLVLFFYHEFTFSNYDFVCFTKICVCGIAIFLPIGEKLVLIAGVPPIIIIYSSSTYDLFP